MKKINRWVVCIAAILLTICLCSVPVLAAGSAGGRNPAAAEASAEPEEPEIEYFDAVQADNRIATTLYIVGGVFVFAGVGGFVCMFVWYRTNKRRDRSEEVKEVILDEIKQSEEMGRRQRIRKPEPAVQVTENPDLYDTQENDFTAPKEAPIIPSTPVSMQPNEVVVRPRVQAVQQPAPVRPADPAPAVKPAAVQPVPVRHEEPAPVAKPAPVVSEPVRQETPAAKPKYDLDDILREIREGKL